MLVITHDLDFAAENLDRLVRLAAGRIVQDAPLSTAWAAGSDAGDASAPQLVRLAGQLGLTGPALTPAALVAQIASEAQP